MKLPGIILLVCVILTSCHQRQVSETTLMNRNELMGLIENPPNDKIQVLNFWATWCEPCVEELPLLEDLSYRDNVEVVLISIDQPADDLSSINKFLKEYNITTKVHLLDDPYHAEWVPMVDSHWDGAIPATLIQKGEKRIFYNRSFTEDDLNKELKKFL